MPTVRDLAISRVSTGKAASCVEVKAILPRGVEESFMTGGAYSILEEFAPLDTPSMFIGTMTNCGTCWKAIT
jgi:hypothetical protein